MLFSLLSHTCRFFAVLLGLTPFVTIDAAPNHLLSYLIVSAIAIGGAALLCVTAERIEPFDEEEANEPNLELAETQDNPIAA